MLQKFNNETHIQIAGALILASGVHSLISLIASAMAGELSINLGFIAIFVGLNILKGIRSGSALAIVFLALGLLSFPLVLFLPNQAKSLSGIFNITEVIVAMGILAYILVVLCISHKSPWFKEPRKITSPLIWATVILTALFSIQRIAENNRLGQVKPHEITIRAFDDDTGEKLSHPSFSYRDDISSNRNNYPDWVKSSSVSSTSDGEGHRISWRGYILEELSLTVGASGYYEKTLTHRKGDPRSLEVALKRKNEVAKE